MRIRSLLAIAACAWLAGCSVIEFKVNPPLPRPHVSPEAAKAATTVTTSTAATSGTQARPLPGGVPLTGEMAPTSGPLNLTVEGAIVLALASNRALKVDEYNPAIRETFVAQQRAAFDPTLTGDLRYLSSRSARSANLSTTAGSFTGGGTGGFGGGLGTGGGLIGGGTGGTGSTGGTGTGGGTGGTGGGGATPAKALPVAQATPTPTPVPTGVSRSPFFTSRQASGSIGLSEFLPTGTTIGLLFSAGNLISGGNIGSFNTTNATTNFSSTSFPWVTRAGLSISQQLLNGAGLGVNLATLRQARLDVLSSEYELRGFTESMVSNVEQAYWNYLYAERQIRILEDAFNVAQRQLDETLQRIRVGKLAASERFSAEAEVASRREALINGRSQLEQARLALQRLLSPPGDSLAPRPISLLSVPLLPERPYDNVADEVALALRMRPDLNQARLAVKRDELDVVRTKNGLLPNLELFVNLGKTGYADSFGGAVSNIDDGNGHDMTAEAVFSYPLGNRAARAQYRRARLARDQQREAVDNMAELVEQDVRGAIIEADRVREQVAATAVTRQLQQETLRTEQEKFRVGRSTSLLVAQAERDLLTAQINELQAFVAYLNAIVNLYRLDGSLLERRGVLCPGAQPVVIP